MTRRERAEHALGFRLPATAHDWNMGVIVSLVGFVVVVVWQLAATYALDPVDTPVGGFADGYGVAGGWYQRVMASVAAGVWEEVVWRGMLFAPFVAYATCSRRPRLVLATGIVLTSASFGTAHLVGYAFPIVQAGTAFIFGVAFCLARLRSGSIWPGVLVHFWINVT